MKKLVVFLFILTFLNIYCNEKKVINLNTIEVPPFSNQNGTGFSDLIIKEAFNRIGYEVNILHIPAPERAMQNADIGIDDGTFSRTKVVEKLYKNIVCVNESAIDWEAVIFSKKVKFNVENWESVNPYHLGYIKGWKILETNIKNTKSLITANDENNLFDLLINDRIEIAIFERYQGLELLKNRGVKGIFILDKPIVAAPMFIYLNKTHTALVPKLEEALREMKKDGTYYKIKKTTLGTLNISKE